MPDLSANQFRLFDPGPGAYNHPDPSEGAPVDNPNPPQGQMVLPVENPDSKEYVSMGRGGVLPVTEDTDPDYAHWSFQVGGMHRSPTPRPGASGRRSAMITEHWENQPVETIPAGTTLRSGQVSTWDVDAGRKDDYGYDLTQPVASVEVDDMHVDSLKGATQFTDTQSSYAKGTEEDTPRHPWVMEINPRGGETKRYLLEGNHRTAAMRESGGGDMRAHVFRAEAGKSLDAATRQFIDQLPDDY